LKKEGANANQVAKRRNSKGENMLLFFRKVLNSYLTPRFLFNKIITDDDFNALLNSNSNKNKNKNSFSYKLNRRIRKLVFFWPTIVDADSWIEGDFGKYRDPSHFIDLRPGIDELLLKKVQEYASGNDAPVLDLGCNSGRHIEYLYNNGFRNITGVDVMKNALLYFQRRCPNVYKNSHIYHNFFQRFLQNTSAAKFEIVYSVGATIEIVHPSFDVIGEMCRVSRLFVIVLVQENKHSYPRFYVSEFKKNNFKLTYSQRPIGDSTVSLLVFERKNKN
jgi:hypothetical protein